MFTKGQDRHIAYMVGRFVTIIPTIRRRYETILSRQSLQLPSRKRFKHGAPLVLMRFAA
jgi:hypothetical protein